jgi:DNA-binding transcriptional ArsR family regulator
MVPTSTKKGLVLIMEKMTNAKALDYVISTFGEELPTEVREKIEKMKEQVVKKNSKDRKPTATQVENVGLKDAILSAMEDGKAYTIGDLMKAVSELDGLTNQRVSALVRQLKEDGLVTREEIKRKAYFTKVEVEDEE